MGGLNQTTSGLGASGNPGGPISPITNGQVAFSDGTHLVGDTGFTFDSTTNSVAAGGFTAKDSPSQKRSDYGGVYIEQGIADGSTADQLVYHDKHASEGNAGHNDFSVRDLREGGPNGADFHYNRGSGGIFRVADVSLGLGGDKLTSTATITRWALRGQDGFTGLNFVDHYNLAVEETSRITAGDNWVNQLILWDHLNGAGYFDYDYAYDWLFAGQAAYFDVTVEFGWILTRSLSVDVLVFAGDLSFDGNGSYLRYTGTGGHTLTLPLASGNFGASGSTHSVRNTFGSVFDVKNRGTGNLTIARAGTDTIEGAASILLLPGQAVRLIAVSSSSWDIL